jgi:[protein-PII] uridylyltransferase
MRSFTPTKTLNQQEALQTLTQNLPDCNQTSLRKYLQNAHEHLKEWFMQGVDTEQLISLYSQAIDALIIKLWQEQNWPENVPVALFAVGGYGRNTLHPHSDIDIAIILADDNIENQDYANKIQAFIACLWDSKLKIGHSVRSLSSSLELAQNDLTILTNLLDGRLLFGDETFAQNILTKLYSIYPTETFIQNRYQEQQKRYARYALPPYTLEPDIKHSPGGLRDIQLIEWLMSFKYHTHNPLEKLSEIFTEKEIKDWLDAKHYLNTLRFGLHLQLAKPSDQLFFADQLQLARLFNEQAADNNQAVSEFMRRYFKYVRRIEILTKRGLQQLGAFTEPELHINDIPANLFEIFARFSEDKKAARLPVAIQRLLDSYGESVPVDCYTIPEYQKLFLRILRSHKVASTLTLMSDYHLLGRYIPLFAHITGMMQYDLFHAYPVDQHTLLLVNQLEIFVHAQNLEKFPLASTIADRIAKPELLYLAGFFHDIGKGQGGHHEEIGAIAVKEFCQSHQYSESETQLVTWLVENHLLLSHTAQHQDITNPAIIQAFAELVKDNDTLDYLYLLTVADIYATNPKLWTAWRISLIESLYRQTHRILSEPHQHQQALEMLKERQQETLALLPDKDHEKVKEVWQHFNPDYFLSYTSNQLAEHVRNLMSHYNLPIVLLSPHHTQSATEIFIYTEHHKRLFFAITSLLDQLQLSIVAADIHTTNTKNNLSTYIVLQRSNKPLEYTSHIERVQKRLLQQLKNINTINPPELKALSDRLQTFNYPTLTEFSNDTYSNCTLLRLITADRPGLLATVAHVCYNQGMQIVRAQVNTLAERAEDIFWLLNANNQMLNPEEQTNLAKELQTVLGCD